MRSILGQILAWLAGTLVLAAVSFMGVSVALMEQRAHDPRAATLLLQLEGAARAFEHEGATEAGAYLAQLRLDFGGEYYLTDAGGRDLVNGADRSAAIAGASPHTALWPPRRHRPVVAASADGRYRLIAFTPHPLDLLALSPYYAWIPLAILALAYVLARHLAAPARRLRDTVERFGHGDLTVRCRSSRPDEFGDLSRSFDRMADRIEELIADERRLLQDVSHEIRSPLARLKYAVELADAEDTRQAALAQIRKDVNRLTELAADLLESTRSEPGPGSGGGETPLDPLIADIAADCRLDGPCQGRRIVTTVAPGLTVRGDVEGIRRAIENVVRNGVSHTPQGTPVTVRAEREGSVVRITVRDLGPGVPQEELERIFRPFYRLDASRHAGTGGTGLGLAIAERAVARHGGRISARNMNPGLEIAIELPA